MKMRMKNGPILVPQCGPIWAPVPPRLVTNTIAVPQCDPIFVPQCGPILVPQNGPNGSDFGSSAGVFWGSFPVCFWGVFWRLFSLFFLGRFRTLSSDLPTFSGSGFRELAVVPLFDEQGEINYSAQKPRPRIVWRAA